MAEYEYDALGRRVEKKIINSGDWDCTYRYYWDGWKMLEVRNGSDEVLKQYVWSLRYIDSPILRDENKNSDGDCTDGADERIYYVADVNMNITCLTNENRGVLERYTYDPYGNVTIYNADYSSTRSTSSYDNPVLFAGYWRDVETEIYHVRHRYYHAKVGRWVQRDALEYADGMHLYQYAGSNPIRYLDPDGLKIEICKKPADFGIGNHVFFWDPVKKKGCGRTAKSGSSGKDSAHTEKHRKGSVCKDVPGSDGHEKCLMDNCEQHANDGIWLPVFNDCHNSLTRALKKCGLCKDLPFGRL